MKLYMTPVSTATASLFIAENGIPMEEEVVDMMQGAHYRSRTHRSIPNRLVPILEDGDFRLTESSAILKYLADKSIRRPIRRTSRNAPRSTR